MNCLRSQRGASAVELLGVVAMFVTLVLTTGPPLVEAVRNSRVRAGARLLAGEILQARSTAVATGWQYRVVGFAAGASDQHRNQFRVMARQSPSSPWPATDAAPFESATMRAGEWIDFGTLYPGVAVSPSDTGEFGLSFDVKGAPFEVSLNLNPLQILGEDGAERWLTVSAVGNVKIQ